MKNKLTSHTHLTCPFCGFRGKMEIPADFCLIFHRCANCNMSIKPASGDCCIFCSYGDIVCIPKQRERLHAGQAGSSDFAAL